MVSDLHKDALVFECEGDRLIGILTRPLGDSSKVTTAMIAVPAGGPQYRVGLGRQLLQQASHFCKHGVAVFRFDYRGIGDSEGKFYGFRSIDVDLRAAIDELKVQLPELKNIILWGGCNAASAIFMHAWRFPEVNGIIVNNPFLGKHNLGEQAKLMHFVNRVREKEFWTKLFSGKYDLTAYGKAFWEAVMRKLTSNPTAKTSSQGGQMSSTMNTTEMPTKPVQGIVLTEMCDGIDRYQGHCLLFLSGQSIQSNEFKVLLKRSKSWKKIMQRPNNSILEISKADQNFASMEGRNYLRDRAYEWIVNTGLHES